MEGSTRSRILKAAREEFMDKGFRCASLRTIAAAAGVTTGAFYGYFKSKSQVFDALVKEQYDWIIGEYRNVLKEFQALPADQQTSSISDHTAQAVARMTDYIYDHFPAFQLLLCASEGTVYENLVDDMANIDVEATHDFARTMETMGSAIQPVNPQLEHMLTHGMFSAYFELVVHQIPRDQADGYIRQLLEFYSAGWQKLMGF